MANTASTIFLLSLVWGVERLCLTLFNLAVAVFLQREWRMGGLSVLGTIYMALQVVPITLIALNMGVWLDTIDRLFAVLRVITVKSVLMVMIFATCCIVVSIEADIGPIGVIPLFFALVVLSGIVNSMHVTLNIAIERVWVVLASETKTSGKQFFVKCNSWMSISKDIGQVLALMMFKPIISGHATMYVIMSLLTVAVASFYTLQYIIFSRINSGHLRAQIQCDNHRRRSLKMAVQEFTCQADAPVGICWAARSTFTASWLATVIMQSSPISILCKWLYTISSIATSLLYQLVSPYIKPANLLFYVTIAEVVGVLMAVIPVLSHKFEVDSFFTNSTMIEATSNAQHVSSIAFSEIKLEFYHMSLYIILALALVLGAVCQRAWNLAALQIFQESVGRSSRGTVGGVQSALDYAALTFHGCLAVMSWGKEYMWMCGAVGLALSVSTCIVTWYWRRTKSHDRRENVTLLRSQWSSIGGSVFDGAQPL